MKDPVDLELARYRARVDQLQSALGEAFLELDRGATARLIRECAKGDLSELDDRERSLVGWLAVVAFFGIFELEEG